MLEFQVPAVSCNHCVRAVTEAVHEVDPQARVQVDLPQHKVTVDSSADRQALVEALTEAGYAPA
jgi:copper chaperone